MNTIFGTMIAGFSAFVQRRWISFRLGKINDCDLLSHFKCRARNLLSWKGWQPKYGTFFMTDVVDVKTRSRMMAGIRSEGTQPEKLVRSSLHRRGFRFAKSSLGLVGKPDIVLPRWKVLVFVHGCFWHLHGCSLSKMPGSNREFWEKKLMANKLRDERVSHELLELGWRILIVWECTTKGRHARDHLDEVMDEIAIWIRQQSGTQGCIASGTGLTF